VDAEDPPAPAAEDAAPAEPAAVNPWAGLLEVGFALLQQLVPAAPGQQVAANGQASLIQRDERTGESYIRLPVPPPDVLAQAVGAMQKLLESFRR
jgi:hypothetical protein